MSARFFTERITGDQAVLSGDDLRHLKNVLRLGVGDELTLCDGQGTDYKARIAALGGEQATLTLLFRIPSATESVHRVTLFQALPKAGKMEVILQKCTELGAAAFVPLCTERCVALPGKDFEKKRARWQRVVYEAAKQSRRGVVPVVEALCTPESAAFSAFDLTLLAYEQEEQCSLKTALRRYKAQCAAADAATCGESVPKSPAKSNPADRIPGKSRLSDPIPVMDASSPVDDDPIPAMEASSPAAPRIALIVGPEGGFSPREVARFTALGAVSVSLGKRILRTETAGMAMLTQLLYELEG